MKVFVTGYNKRLLEDEEKQPKITIHLTKDCELLAESNTGIHPIECPVILTFKKLVDPFLYEGKSIHCCPSCTPKLFPEIVDFMVQRDRVNNEIKMRNEAKEKALRLFKLRFPQG